MPNSPVETCRIYTGNCVEVMRHWPDNFVDTVICDPPYELNFMSKRWDSSGIAFNVEVWKECLRVCKPGAMLLSFGGDRTHHRMMVAIEDAGWEIRTCLYWCFGSGFPKSLNISKAIDRAKRAERKQELVLKKKSNSPERAGPIALGASGMTDISMPITDLAKQWDGWGTSLKPAVEIIVMAMKPLDGTFADNAEKWGVAGINVDGGRIAGDDTTTRHNSSSSSYMTGSIGEVQPLQLEYVTGSDKGRWPANLLLDEEAAGMLDQNVGSLQMDRHQKRQYSDSRDTSIFGIGGNNHSGRIDAPGGPSRFFYVAKSARAERNEGCEDMEDVQTTDGCLRSNPDSARKYQANSALRKNHHPTVKPLELMKYLCQLTRTPTGGIVLDPFAGSGTTLWAAEFHNRPWIGIEMNPEYVAIAEARIAGERAQLKMAI